MSDVGPDPYPSIPTPTPATNNALHVLSRRRWWIVLCCLASLATAWFYVSKQTPIYSSSSRLYVQMFTRMVTEDRLNEANTGQAAQKELISSTPLLNEVAELPEIRDMDIMKGVENPTAFIKQFLTVEAEKEGFINITFESPNRVEAAQLVNAVADAYVSFTGKQHHNTAAEILKILAKEKEKRELELDGKRKLVLEFQRSHGILSFRDEKGNIVMQRLAKLSESLTNAQIEVMDAQANLDAAEQIKGDPIKILELAKSATPKGDMDIKLDNSEASRDPIDMELLGSVRALRADIEQTQRRVERLKRTRTPLHKDVLDAQAELAMLETELKRDEGQLVERKQKLVEQEQKLMDTKADKASKEIKTRQEELDKRVVTNYLTLLYRRANMAKQREHQLQINFEEQKQMAFDLNATAAEFTSLASDLSRSENLVNLLMDRMKDINVNEDTNVVSVTVIDSARPGDAPIRPDKKRIMGMGLILGLVLGIGLAFGLDLLDQRIHSTEEVSALLGVPVLGLVPNISNQESPSVRGRKVLLEPTSDVSEAYRTIRTAVYFAARDEKTKKLLVTSPAPGDGKTTSASNLAIAMAQAGQRVLLVDADFRRPTMHKIFDIVPEIGLSSVMSGLAPLEKAIYRTEVENLHLLPCGPIPRNPSELLNGQAFADLLEGLERKYDHIVIDSPPVAPVTDARILGALCDETILVLRAEKSTRRLSEHARTSLLSVGANLLGVIVNDVPRNRKGYRYYSGYGYGYRYYRYGYSYGPDKGPGVKELPPAESSPTEKA
jgi:succinoglycan biosynthesis transport protein ExoP